MEKKFLVDGRELATYQLSNRQIVDLYKKVEGDTESDEAQADKAILAKAIIDRFDYECCPKPGENNDDVFARQFSNYVNGRMYSRKEVAKLIANDHRELLKYKFNLCVEYIKVLADNYEHKWFDGRNEMACMQSAVIKKALDAFEELNKYRAYKMPDEITMK